MFINTDGSIFAMLAGVDRRRLPEVFLIVKPATVIGWHRRLVAHPLDPAAHAQAGPALP